MGLVRQLLTESLTLATVGGLLGLLLAYVAIDVLVWSAPAGLPRAGEVSFDGHVFGVGIGLILVTALLSGILPALRASRQNPGAASREGARGTSAAKFRPHQILTASQIAFAVVVLVFTALLTMSFRRLLSAELGFVITFDVNLPDTGYGTGESRARFFREFLTRVERLPGVKAAAATSRLPATGHFNEQYANNRNWSLTTAVRTAGSQAGVLAAIRRELAAMDRGLVAHHVRPLPVVAAAGVARGRLATFLMGGFGLTALALALTGIYSLLACLVTDRTHEIGIRIALDAHSAEVLLRLLGSAARMIVVGLVLGLAGAVALTRVMESLLFQVSALDPLALTVACVSMLAVGLLAGFIPAMRAARVDPIAVLREEG